MFLNLESLLIRRAKTNMTHGKQCSQKTFKIMKVNQHGVKIARIQQEIKSFQDNRNKTKCNTNTVILIALL